MKILKISLIMLLALCLCSCKTESKELPAPAEIYAEIQSHVQMAEMVNVADQLLEINTGITPDYYAEAVYYLPLDDISPEQVVIIKAKDSAAADFIEENLMSWLNYQIDSARVYMTENMPLLQSGVVRRDGLTVSLIVSPHTDEIVSVYNRMR